MPALSKLACPTCGKYRLRRHCPSKVSKSCRWALCGDCKSYGMPNSAWYDAPRQMATRAAP